MSENEHFTRAKSRLHNGTTNETSRAQAEATLALAYEQRTANLLAFSAMIPRGLMDEDTILLRKEILERLDLK